MVSCWLHDGTAFFPLWTCTFMWFVAAVLIQCWLCIYFPLASWFWIPVPSSSQENKINHFSYKWKNIKCGKNWLQSCQTVNATVGALWRRCLWGSNWSISKVFKIFMFDLTLELISYYFLCQSCIYMCQNLSYSLALLCVAWAILCDVVAAAC